MEREREIETECTYWSVLAVQQASDHTLCSWIGRRNGAGLALRTDSSWRSLYKCSIRPVLKLDERRMIPCTSYPCAYTTTNNNNQAASVRQTAGHLHETCLCGFLYLAEQQLCQVGAILAGDTSHQCLLASLVWQVVQGMGIHYILGRAGCCGTSASSATSAASGVASCIASCR